MSSRNNILFIGSFPSETKGGSSTASLLLLDTPEFQGNNIIKLDSTLESIAKNPLGSRVFRAIKRFLLLFSILIRHKPKSALIFCGHGWSMVEKGLMILIMKRFGVKCIIAPNSGLIVMSLSKPWFKKFLIRVFRKSDHIICQGEYWKKTFLEYTDNPDKLVLLKNWLSDKSVNSELPPFSFPPRNHINLIYMGWLEKYKGVSDLLKAVKKCKDKGVDINLDIWGEGSNQPEFENEVAELGISSEVHFKGWANEQHKEKIYHEMPILVLPSYYEGLPNVVLEAMAHGLPVISTNVSTLPEVITHGKNGLLYDIGNVDQLTNAILELGNDPLAQQSMREKAKSSLDSYDLHKASELLSNLLNGGDQLPSKPSILILSDWFEPAYRGGGPITSCYNFCIQFNQTYDIQVISSNRDFRSSEPLEVETDKWIHKSYGIQAFYASGLLSYTRQLIRIRKQKPDIIYLQGIFSFQFGILPLLLSKIGILRSKIMVAPRGMLQSGAIGQKKLKKIVYLAFARVLRLFKKVYFQATDQIEKTDIEEHIGAPVEHISVLANFPNISDSNSASKNVKKAAGQVKLVYYSRVAPKKNLGFYLDVLHDTYDGNIELGIIGPVENETYWNELKQKINALPSNISVTYYGAMPLRDALDKISEFHFMVLPTLGENYGHVIVESFSQGVPVVISKETPWNDLEEKSLGWDLELDLELFRTNLKHLIGMNDDEYRKLSEACLQFVNNEIQPEITDLKNEYESVLNKLITVN